MLPPIYQTSCGLRCCPPATVSSALLHLTLCPIILMVVIWHGHMK